MSGSASREIVACRVIVGLSAAAVCVILVQVDLWSAGVILYTMLVGRPPYESTDVKSTYRRILANVYAFPDSVPVSDSAKNLVGRLLQVRT